MKIFTRILFVFILGGLVVAACGSGNATPSGPKGDATAGATKFAGTCSACHGPDAKGITGLGKDLTTSGFAKGKTDGELVEFVKSGRPSSDPLNTTGVDMPPRGGNPALADQDLADIVAYLRTLQK